MSGGNQSASGARLYADAMSVIECATVNAVIDRNQRAQAAERNHEAKQKQQMIRAVEDVANPSATKRPAAWYHRGSSRTSPGSPEYSNGRTAPSGVTKRSTVSVWTPSRASFGRMENATAVGGDRYSNKASTRPEVQVQLRVGRQRCSAYVRERRLVPRERPIRLHRRRADVDNSRGRQRDVVLEQLDALRDPEHRVVGEKRQRAGRRRACHPGASAPACRASTSSGTRTSRRSRRPSGFRNAWIVTSLGMSCAGTAPQPPATARR